jgi:hypothetical protein
MPESTGMYHISHVTDYDGTVAAASDPRSSHGRAWPIEFLGVGRIPGFSRTETAAVVSL